MHACSGFSSRRSVACCTTFPARRPALRPLYVRCTQQGVALSPEALKKQSEVIKSCNTIVRELSGMGFGREEVRLYFQLAKKHPKRVSKDFDLSRSSAAAALLLDGGDAAQIQDQEAVTVMQLMLSDLWRWRRGGGGDDEENTMPEHQQALQEIQQVKVEEADRMSSILLDTLPISDKEKMEIGQSFQKAAVIGFESFIWGAIVFALVILVAFNFLRH